MIPDEISPPQAEAETPSAELKAANDDGGTGAGTVDPRVLIIARTIGRQIAREQLDELHAANDDTPNDER